MINAHFLAGTQTAGRGTSQLLALLAICIPVWTSPLRAQPCTLGLSAQLPVRSATPLIDARINDKPALLELDTGAFTTIVTTQAARRLGLHEDLDRSEKFRGTIDDPISLYGIGGERAAHVVVAKSFEIGTLRARKFHILTADLGISAIDGLLSTDMLQNYDIDLDFVGQQIRIFTAYGSCARPKVLLQSPLYVVPLLVSEEDPLPRVHILIDGHRLTARVDTGSPYTAMFRHTASQLGVPDAAFAANHHARVHGIGPAKIDTIMHVFTSVGIGDLTLKNMPIVIMNDNKIDQTDVLLGADFQQKIHLWISNSSHSLVLQYPPQPSPTLK